MASSEVQSFTEPAEYAAAIQGLAVELTPFRARPVCRELHARSL
jgi:hypothetical protein